MPTPCNSGTIILTILVPFLTFMESTVNLLGPNLHIYIFTYTYRYKVGPLPVANEFVRTSISGVPPPFIASRGPPCMTYEFSGVLKPSQVAY